MRRNFRELLASKIEANGGYQDRHGRFALSWSVPVYGIGEFDIMAALAEQGDFFSSPADVLLRYPNVEELWSFWRADPDQNYDPITEMQESVIDADTYRMWRPEIARKYGFSYTGLGAEKPFKATFEFRGRGGKHLCVTQFEGVELSGELSEQLTDRQAWLECGYGSLWVRQLCGMIEEWDLCFTREAAEAEARYLVVWRFGQWLIETGDEQQAA